MKSNPLLLCVVPSRLELKPLVRALRASPGDDGLFYSSGGHIALWLSGIGKKNLQRGLVPHLLSGRFSAVVSTGCAGALQRGLYPKQVLCPEWAGNRNQRECPLSPEIFERLPGVSSGGWVVSVNKPAGPLAKRVLSRMRPEARLVDMESYWIAAMAREYHIPVAVLRVIADRVEEEIPAWRSDSKKSLLEHWHFYRYIKRARRSCRALARVLLYWEREINSPDVVPE